MTSPPIPPAPVTTLDLLSEVLAARRDIGAVLAEVRVIDARYAQVTSTVADHETRIRDLRGEVPPGLTLRLVAVERWVWKASAIVAAVALIAGLVSGYLGFLIGHVR